MPVRPGEPAETDPAFPFDVREFARRATGSHRDDLRLAEYDARPLTWETLRCLRYVRDVERATMRHLRTVLVTPTHKDAHITAFLTTWAYEKYWIADALDAVLEQHEYVQPPAPRRPVTRAALLRRAQERFSPIGRSLIDNTIGEAVIAFHMATGTIDEWMTRASYERIAESAEHKELTRTLERVLDIKSQHLAFFIAQARTRLRRSRLARRLTRARLQRSLWPLSVADEPIEEESFFFDRVFAAAPALVDEIDRRVRALPGLEGLTLIRATVAARRHI
ncbi:hypothetical protein [Phytoactinopolyspora halotolerans]|uniref:Uncharacterized protein n=1 Tax=Phytoactinopolyspora halotolerans TaxID=1981512 RepID=A0A6L9SDV3_9ACTN|nr:hypothetical protein [Phytoactinopolyspora halotolerans]NEE03219.1 hypothetical protein [Phytoactinopolyspora halotolerans]